MFTAGHVVSLSTGVHMDWNQVEDLDDINGSWEQLEDKLQDGYAKNQIRRGHS
jgi:hypothetical protein